MKNIITLENHQSPKPLHGWILYTEGDESPNPHYIDLYRSACRKRGMSIQLGIYHPDQFLDRINACEVSPLPEDGIPAFAINRTRDYRFGVLLQSMGVSVFNDPLVTQLGNDKYMAYQHMLLRGISSMPVMKGTEEPPQWYPAVVKSCDGHGGAQVYFIRNGDEWKDWKETVWKSRKEQHPEETYIIQQAASDLGKDVRVYIVGNQIKAAVLRTSKTDFRSNYCLGGSVELYELSASERELVQHAVKSLSIGMAGIDFIFHNGKMVFNEMEDVAGARSLYSLTDYDIADDYIGYIQEELQNVKNADRKTDL